MAKPTEKTRKPFFSQDLFKDIVFVVVAFLFINSFVVASFVVPTGSMENEIMAGDFLFVNKFLYGGTSPRVIPFVDVRLPWFRLPAFRSVQRGDVIVFEYPGDRDEVHPAAFQFYLKRCVALSGDTIQVVNRVLYVNGKPFPLPRHLQFDRTQGMPEDYVDSQIFPKGMPYNQDFWGPEVVPSAGESISLSAENLEKWRTFIAREGHIAQLRRDGTVLIDGVPSTSYQVRRNYMFGMGDHRDNSMDSRFWGYIPEENIVGTPMIVYWSWNPDIPIYSLFPKLGSIRLGRVGSIVK